MSLRIHKMISGLKSGRMSARKAHEVLKDLPFQDIGFAKIDNHRSLRRGFPEVVFGKGKTPDQIVSISKRIIAHDGVLLVTRTDEKVYKRLKKLYPKIRFDKNARAIFYRRVPAVQKKGTILVVSAGTADMPIAEEARITAEIMGNKVETLYDVGVAGIHRLLNKRVSLNKADVIVVVAGMEGALASVVSGLVSVPVVAVPTSIGYGASFEGIAPLLTMMNSCSPGVAVVNIDNGFGAGYLASLINK